MHLLPSFLICASGPWALDWSLHYGFPWFLGFWIQAKLCHWLFCFSSLPRVSDGTFWPQWLHETIPIMNLNLSIYHACVCLSECLCALNCLDFFVTLWTVAHQALLSMGVSRQEYWSGLPCPPTGDLPDPGIKPKSPVLASRIFTTEPPGRPYLLVYLSVYLWIYPSRYHLSMFLSYWLQFFEQP